MSSQHMQWASASAVNHDLGAAVSAAASQLRRALKDVEPDLLLVFVAATHQSALQQLSMLLRQEFESATLVAALAHSVSANEAELEDQPAISLLGAVLPNVQVQVTHLEQSTLPPQYAERTRWATAFGIPAQQLPRAMLLIADPYTFAAETLLAATDRLYPQMTTFGGLTSGSNEPQQPCLLINEQVYAQGAIAVLFDGGIQIDTLVTQGCRPIGEPMFANATHDNLILQLDGRVPREVLTDLYQRLPRQERKLFTEALFMGLAMQPQQDRYGSGDFLIRTLLGLDPDSGALLINTRVAQHSVVQLHLRDAETSNAELQQRLSAYRQQQPSAPAAVLLFTCVGRGRSFYGTGDHDSQAWRQYVGDTPLAGMFCNGEIGSVAKRTYVHGYTSVYAIIRSAHSVLN